MRGIQFVPGELGAHPFQTSFNQISTLERDVRILSSPNMQQLTPNLSGAFQRVVALSLAKTFCVDIGRVEAGRGQNIRVHGSSERQMSADADTHDAQAAGARVENF